MSELQFTVPAEQSGKRIDSWLAEQIEGLDPLCGAESAVRAG